MTDAVLRRAVVLQRLTERFAADLWPAGYYVGCECVGEAHAPCDYCVDLAIGRVPRDALVRSACVNVQAAARRRVRDRLVAGVRVRHVVLPLGSSETRVLPGAWMTVYARSPFSMVVPKIVRAALGDLRSFDVSSLRVGHQEYLAEATSLGAIARLRWDTVVEPIEQGVDFMMVLKNVGPEPRFVRLLWHCLTPDGA